MKRLKYLLALCTVLVLGACSSDDTDKLDPKIKAERTALTANTQYGIYQNGQPSYIFDKNQQQLYVNPSKRTYRIQNDLGTKYAEVTLDDEPTQKKGVTGSLNHNVGLSTVTLDEIILLKSDKDHLWLWCDNAHTGFILPRINL